MPTLFQGRIVWIDVPDPNGKNRYRRPVIILNPTHEIESETELQGVVASHTAAQKNPRPVDYVALPYHPQRRVCTQLSKVSVAVCSWLVSFDKDEVSPDAIGGFVPPAVLELIIDKVRGMRAGDD